MEDEAVPVEVEFPPVLYGFLQRLVRSGHFIDPAEAIRYLVRREMRDSIGDPMELRGLVGKKTDPLPRATHPRCLCDD